MTIDEFSEGDSFLHRLDPRVKITITAVFSLVVALEQSIFAAAAAVMLPTAVFIAARAPLWEMLKRLAAVNGFILFLWFFLPFTHPGEVLASFGPVSATRDGLMLALLLTFKSNAIVLAVITFLGTSSVFSLMSALSSMGLPDKLTHLFFFCYRYVHVVHEEYHRLVTAMKVRSFRPRTNVHTYRSYAYLVGMLLVRSFERAGRIASAMKCRGFKGKFYLLHQPAMKGSDYLAAASGAALSVLLLVL
ncbi:MAG: cobalt ECF transporter T component CbiQ [Desulfomonile sp.]|nr:cobalt ECF transporter T component CbiQ [Desulfomonile sp.]